MNLLLIGTELEMVICSFSLILFAIDLMAIQNKLFYNSNCNLQNNGKSSTTYSAYSLKLKLKISVIITN
jgi:hypothetical protein